MQGVWNRDVGMGVGKGHCVRNGGARAFDGSVVGHVAHIGSKQVRRNWGWHNVSGNESVVGWDPELPCVRGWAMEEGIG